MNKFEKRVREEAAKLQGKQVPEVAVELYHSMLPTEAQSHVLAELPTKTQVEVILALAGGFVHPRAWDQPERNSSPRYVALLLRHLPKNKENDLLKRAEKQNPGVAHRIMDSLFIAADLPRLEPRAMKTLLREVGNDTLLIAMSSMREEVKDSIMTVLSPRARELVTTDLAGMGQMFADDVMAAQQTICFTAKRLEAEGKILIPRGRLYFR